MNKDKIRDYYDIGGLDKSPEPLGHRDVSDSGPIFVIHKHDAADPNYDFSLEIGGVLVSWAIPQGPTIDPSVKRLAVPTENYSMDYASFEGEISKGLYEGGKVIVWDKGLYQNISETDGNPISMEEAIAKGHLTFNLKGKKLEGEFALSRNEEEEDARWLFIKMKDDKVDTEKDLLSSEPESVISGKTIEDMHQKDRND